MERILCPRASGVLSALGLIASERRRDTARTVLLERRRADRRADRGGGRRAARVDSPAGLPDARGRGRLRAALPRPGLRAARRRARRRPTRPSWRERFARRARGAATATATPTRRSSWSTCGWPLVEPGRGATPRPADGAALSARAARGRASAASGWRPRCCAASRRRATTAEGPCVFELPEATLVLPPGLAGRGGRRAGRSCAERSDELTRPRPGHAPGPRRRAARRLRGDGRGARARGPLGEHQGAARLLDGAVRRRRRAGDAGRAHPGPPRLDARRGRRRARRGAPPGRRLDPQRPLPRRHPPARHHPDLARLRRRTSLLGFAASRAHHADVGGPTPGGMPADSTRLEDEGVVIPPTRADDGRARATSPRGCATRASGSPTCARSAPPTCTGERRLLELAERTARSRAALRDGGDPRLRRAPHARPRWPSCPTAPTRRRTCWRPTPRGAARHRLRVTREIEGDG